MVAMSKSRPRVLNFFSKARPSTEIRGRTGAAGKTPLIVRLSMCFFQTSLCRWGCAADDSGTGHQGQATAFAILFTTLIVL
jgi:hypothetical protein